MLEAGITSTAGGPVQRSIEPKTNPGTKSGVPTSATIATTTVAGTTVTLYEGYVTEGAEGTLRGYGMAYIEEAAGLTEAEVTHVLNNGEPVVSNGELRYIIDQVDEKAIILTIIGGTLMAASDGYQDVDEPTEGCNKKIHYNRKKLKDHVVDTDKKAIDSIQEILDGIKKFKDLWKSSRYRYYIGESTDGYFIVKVTKDNPFFDLVVNTVLMDEGGSYYDSLKDAQEQLDDNQPDDPDQIEDPSEPNC